MDADTEDLLSSLATVMIISWGPVATLGWPSGPKRLAKKLKCNWLSVVVEHTLQKCVSTKWVPAAKNDYPTVTISKVRNITNIRRTCTVAKNMAMEWIRGPLDDKGRENGAKHLKDKETQATVRAYQKTHQGFGGRVRVANFNVFSQID